MGDVGEAEQVLGHSSIRWPEGADSQFQPPPMDFLDHLKVLGRGNEYQDILVEDRALGRIGLIDLLGQTLMNFAVSQIVLVNIVEHKCCFDFRDLQSWSCVSLEHFLLG